MLSLWLSRNGVIDCVALSEQFKSERGSMNLCLVASLRRESSGTMMVLLPRVLEQAS